jgi:hypothetical protein
LSSPITFNNDSAALKRSVSKDDRLARLTGSNTNSDERPNSTFRNSSIQGGTRFGATILSDKASNKTEVYKTKEEIIEH